MQAGEGESESDTMVRPSGPRSSPYGAHRSGGGALSGRSNRVLLLVVGLIVVGLFGESWVVGQNVHVVVQETLGFPGVESFKAGFGSLEEHAEAPGTGTEVFQS